MYLQQVSSMALTSWHPSDRLNPVIAGEVIESMHLELPQSSEWTEVNITSKLLRVITKASGRVFVGPELCRDESYINAAINYTIDLMIAVHTLTLLPSWLRAFMSPWLPSVRKLQRRIYEADAFLRPIVTARKQAAADSNYQSPDDLLQWLIDGQNKYGVKDDEKLAQYQLSISFTAIQTTTSATVNVQVPSTCPYVPTRTTLTTQW